MASSPKIAYNPANKHFEANCSDGILDTIFVFPPDLREGDDLPNLYILNIPGAKRAFRVMGHYDNELDNIEFALYGPKGYFFKMSVQMEASQEEPYVWKVKKHGETNGKGFYDHDILHVPRSICLARSFFLDAPKEVLSHWTFFDKNVPGLFCKLRLKVRIEKGSFEEPPLHAVSAGSNRESLVGRLSAARSSLVERNVPEVVEPASEENVHVSLNKIVAPRVTGRRRPPKENDKAKETDTADVKPLQLLSMGEGNEQSHKSVPEVVQENSNVAPHSQDNAQARRGAESGLMGQIFAWLADDTADEVSDDGEAVQLEEASGGNYADLSQPKVGNTPSDGKQRGNIDSREENDVASQLMRRGISGSCLLPLGDAKDALDDDDENAVVVDRNMEVTLVKENEGGLEKCLKVGEYLSVVDLAALASKGGRSSCVLDQLDMPIQQSSSECEISAKQLSKMAETGRQKNPVPQVRSSLKERQALKPRMYAVKESGLSVADEERLQDQSSRHSKRPNVFDDAGQLPLCVFDEATPPPTSKDGLVKCVLDDASEAKVVGKLTKCVLDSSQKQSTTAKVTSETDERDHGSSKLGNATRESASTIVSNLIDGNVEAVGEKQKDNHMNDGRRRTSKTIVSEMIEKSASMDNTKDSSYQSVSKKSPEKMNDKKYRLVQEIQKCVLDDEPALAQSKLQRMKKCILDTTTKSGNSSYAQSAIASSKRSKPEPPDQPREAPSLPPGPTVVGKTSSSVTQKVSSNFNSDEDDSTVEESKPNSDKVVSMERHSKVGKENSGSKKAYRFDSADDLIKCVLDDNGRPRKEGDLVKCVLDDFVDTKKHYQSSAKKSSSEEFEGTETRSSSTKSTTGMSKKTGEDASALKMVSKPQSDKLVKCVLDEPEVGSKSQFVKCVLDEPEKKTVKSADFEEHEESGASSEPESILSKEADKPSRSSKNGEDASALKMVSKPQSDKLVKCVLDEPEVGSKSQLVKCVLDEPENKIVKSADFEEHEESGASSEPESILSKKEVDKTSKSSKSNARDIEDLDGNKSNTTPSGESERSSMSDVSGDVKVKDDKFDRVENPSFETPALKRPVQNIDYLHGQDDLVKCVLDDAKSKRKGGSDSHFVKCVLDEPPVEKSHVSVEKSNESEEASSCFRTESDAEKDSKSDSKDIPILRSKISGSSGHSKNWKRPSEKQMSMVYDPPAYKRKSGKKSHSELVKCVLDDANRKSNSGGEFVKCVLDTPSKQHQEVEDTSNGSDSLEPSESNAESQNSESELMKEETSEISENSGPNSRKYKMPTSQEGFVRCVLDQPNTAVENNEANTKMAECVLDEKSKYNSGTGTGTSANKLKDSAPLSAKVDSRISNQQIESKKARGASASRGSGVSPLESKIMSKRKSGLENSKSKASQKSSSAKPLKLYVTHPLNESRSSTKSNKSGKVKKKKKFSFFRRFRR